MFLTKRNNSKNAVTLTLNITGRQLGAISERERHAGTLVRTLHRHKNSKHRHRRDYTQVRTVYKRGVHNSAMDTSQLGVLVRITSLLPFI